MSFFTVGQNELTVVNRFGEFRYVAGPGLHFKVPLIDGTQTYRTDIRAMYPEKAVNTYTIDNQEVDVVYTVFYRVPADRVAYIFTNNRDYESRLAAMTVDRLKAAMGQVNVSPRSAANCAMRSRRPWITTSRYWGSRSPISN